MKCFTLLMCSKRNKSGAWLRMIGSNIANHAWTHDHRIGFDNEHIIDKGNYRQRKLWNHGTRQKQPMPTTIQEDCQNNIPSYFTSDAANHNIKNSTSRKHHLIIHTRALGQFLWQPVFRWPWITVWSESKYKIKSRLLIGSYPDNVNSNTAGFWLDMTKFFFRKHLWRWLLFGIFWCAINCQVSLMTRKKEIKS